MRNRSCLGLITVVMLAGGCAHAPALQVATRGQWPADDKPTYGFGRFDAGEDPTLRARIAACIGNRGMTPSDTPAYLVQVGLSDRPAKADILPGDQAATPESKRAQSKRPSQALIVDLTDMANGKEVYRVAVTGQYRRPAARRPASALADAACQTLEGKAETATASR